MSHKKCLYSLLVVGLAAATAYATPELRKPTRVAAERASEGSDEGASFTSTEPQPVLNLPTIQSTNFDPADGWDLGFSVCGNEFAGNNAQGGPCCVQGAVTDVCGAGLKDFCADQNCCIDDPNQTNGWFMNILMKHCNEPHIDTIHPGSSGGQHLRFVNPGAGGNVVCAAPLYSGATCRMRVHTPPDRAPGNTQNLLGRSVFSYEIAISQAIGNTRFRTLPGFHTEAPGGGGIYAYNGNGLSGVYFNFNGRVQICRTVACPDTAAGRLFLAYWSYDSGGYGKVTIDNDRCNNLLTISYQNAAEAVPPAVPGFVNSFSTSVNSGTGTPLWNKPFGPHSYYPLTDQVMFFKNNPPSDPTTLDLDNWSLVHTPCPTACCNAGVCTDSPYSEANSDSCIAAGGRYYPNVSCAQMGTNGIPPCGVDLGSCCNSGPGTGGTCTDGVAESACTGAQLTWTAGATCDPDGFPSLCNISPGTCSNAYPGHAAPHFCVNRPGYEPCLADSDCDDPGFCFGGHCSQPSTPGTCAYISAGFCQAMGQCTGAPPCVPSTGANCCDPVCPVACPGGAVCQAISQPCNAVPGGADCAFCEGCDAFPTVGCTTDADCPSPRPGIPAGVCEPNPTFVCNNDGDCPAGTTCQVPAVSPGGVLCTTDDECLTYVTAAPACDETPGACCEQVFGTCEDNVLSADCPTGTAAQMIWSKGQSCTAVGCSADLGACCDHETFGGCTETTFVGCPTEGTKNEWTKEATCAEIECTHVAIPTVSEWGIVVLTLLLLVGAKVYFGRRQASAA